MSAPSSTTLPALGVSRPASKPSKVDLPEPEAPTMASVSAFRTVKSTSCKIVSSPLASATRLARPLTAMAATDPVPDAGAATLAAKPGPSGMKWEDALGKSGMLNMFNGFKNGLSRKLSAQAAAALLLAAAAASAYSAPKTVLVLGDSLSAE